jgi:hypothetical protein
MPLHACTGAPIVRPESQLKSLRQAPRAALRASGELQLQVMPVEHNAVGCTRRTLAVGSRR